MDKPYSTIWWDGDYLEFCFNTTGTIYEKHGKCLNLLTNPKTKEREVFFDDNPFSSLPRMEVDTIEKVAMDYFYKQYSINSEKELFEFLSEQKDKTIRQKREKNEGNLEI